MYRSNGSAPSGERLRRATIAVVAGRGERAAGEPLNPPPIFASAFRAGSGRVYSRDGNPTWEQLEAALGALEGGTAVAFSSGMAAAAAALEELPPRRAGCGCRLRLCRGPEAARRPRGARLAAREAGRPRRRRRGAGRALRRRPILAGCDLEPDPRRTGARHAGRRRPGGGGESGVRVLTHATSLGGVETLIERPRGWDARPGVPDGLLRVSAGCEDPEDLWRDLERAIALSAGAGAST